MNQQLNELHLRRGRLLERIAAQRATLAREVRPVQAALGGVDRAVGRVRRVTDYLRQHPSVTALAIGGLFFVKTERAWRWTRRAFFAWQAWRTFGDKLNALGLRARP